jgi:rod shape-determining protein MreC
VVYTRRSGRSRFTLLLLLLTAVTLLVVDLPGTGPLEPVRNALGSVLSPVRETAVKVFDPVTNAWHGMFGYDDVKKENEALRRQLEKAQTDQARVKQLEQENEDLKRAQGIKVGNEQSVTARVISGPVTSFDRTVTIDQGSGNGVRKGNAVVSAGGLVGRVSRVSGSRATVELLTEPSFNVGIAIPRVREQGIAQGQGQGRDLLVDDGIASESGVKKGDDVFTSGDARSYYPPNIRVGKVTKVTDTVVGDEVTLRVEPSADLTSLTYVKVVLREPT